MKSIIRIIVLPICLFYATASYSLTGDEAAAKFRSRMYGISKLTGIISWSDHTGQTFTGSFKYLNPGMIYVKFSSPAGKIVVSNGKRLWIYSPSSNICGVQDLYPGSSGGIAGLTQGYMAILTSQSASGYTLKLKSGGKTYPEIILLLDSTFFLKRAILKNGAGETTSFSISNRSFSAPVMRSLFDFNVPANAQVVKNPLNVR
ncbi:MAG: outer membrane lipoprotein carrier protein LolA [bacterium]|nr:outer membrane lipoprotein carrier protein LolA [bacterium]